MLTHIQGNLGKQQYFKKKVFNIDGSCLFKVFQIICQHTKNKRAEHEWLFSLIDLMSYRDTNDSLRRCVVTKARYLEFIAYVIRLSPNGSRSRKYWIGLCVRWDRTPTLGKKFWLSDYNRKWNQTVITGWTMSISLKAAPVRIEPVGLMNRIIFRQLFSFWLIQ